MQPTDKIWPPPPKLPVPNRVPVYAIRYLTGINWLDAILGVPAGFLIGAILWGIAVSLVQAVRGLPSPQQDMETACISGFILTVMVYVLIGRRYSLFGFTMFLGGLPFYLLMLFLAWYAS